MRETDAHARGRGHSAGTWIAIAVCVLFLIGWVSLKVVPRLLIVAAVADCNPKVDSDIRALDSALEDYAAEHLRRYPETLERLLVPNEDGFGYLKSEHIPGDPWGTSYLYTLPERDGDRPTVRTLGKDGRSGGRGANADIDNHSLRSESTRAMAR